MNWDKCLILIGQVAVLGVLGSLVALGHNSAIQDGMMAVSGSLIGVGLYQAVRSKSSGPSA